MIKIEWVFVKYGAKDFPVILIAEIIWVTTLPEF